MSKSLAAVFYSLISSLVLVAGSVSAGPGDDPFGRRVPSGFFDSMRKIKPALKKPVKMNEHTGTGVVIRVLSAGSGACFADILQQNGKAFTAWVTYEEERRRERTAACHTLVEAAGSQKLVQAGGKVRDYGNPENNSLGSIDADYINYFEGDNYPETETIVLEDCDSGSLADCDFNGTVVRVLNWTENETTACMATMRLTTNNKLVKVWKRQSSSYSMYPDSKNAFDTNMLQDCQVFAEGVSSGRKVWARGSVEEGTGGLAVSYTEINGPQAENFPFPSAF